MANFNGFDGDYTGLSIEEVKKLQAIHGKNELVPEKKDTLLKKIIIIGKEPMFLLLFCTALLYFILGEPKDGIIMLYFVLFISSINIFQEWRTDKTLQALKDLSSPRIRVIRNSRIENIDSKELTVGDLMVIEEGEKIPADGEIIEMRDLGIDESTLTGESDVVWKKNQLDDEEKDSHWRKDRCYAGTTVTQGSSIIKVTSIGLKTEYGKIGLDIMSVPERPTPLEKQIRQLVKISAFVGLAMFTAVFLVTLVHSKDVIDSILSGVTLAMAMIPEELPVILTVFLAMGAWRLAKKNSLIRRIPSVETLGAVSVLCVDKTGTLTKNQMTVQEVYGFGKTSEKELLYWAGLGCEPDPYDPMEKAILESVYSKDISKETLFSNELLFEYPFSLEAKMMGHVWKIDGASALAAKGSPESIFPLCNLSESELEQLRFEQERLAVKGFRVIAVSNRREMQSIPQNLKDNKMDLLGLIGLADPPREVVPDAVKVCNNAGVRVVMITGDNGTTARSIAKKIGIPDSDNVITGKELDSMSDDELKSRLKTTNIFARVIPKHKMHIVKALKDGGEVVAMTGDGVNDAPALKYSDIGIAMGKRGTGVAKEAADMILLDDNFETIVNTVKDGRRIYDNIKKAIVYVFVIHIPIALIALLTPLLHLPLLLLPIHVVLLELIIDPTCSIVFERQVAEKDIMKRKPRPPKSPLITIDLLVKAILQGLAIFAAAFGGYVYGINAGWEVNIARTLALTVLILANILLVYVNQSVIDFRLLTIFKLKDKVRVFVNLGILIGLGLIVYAPFVNNIAKTTPLHLNQMLMAIVLAMVSTLWWEVVKVIKRLKIKRLETNVSH